MTCPCCSRPILSLWDRLLLWLIAGALSILTVSVVWWARGQWDGQVAVAEKAKAVMWERVADGVVERDIKKQLAAKERRP